MKDVKKSLSKWLKETAKYELVSYEKLPDIDLYMEQLMIYLDKVMFNFQISSFDKVITPAMINNYVKGEVIPAPLSKRYSKEHIAKIIEICMLKKSLPINNIKDVMDATYEPKKVKVAYNDFKDLTNEVLHTTSKNVSKKLTQIEDGDDKALLKLATELSLSASVNTMISERIFEYLKIKKDLEQ